MDNLLNAETPPGNLTNYAGFWRRAAALFIDMLILSVPVYFLATWFSDNPTPEINPTTTEAIEYQYFNIYNATSFLINWLYFSLFESSAKQATLGKQAMNLYVCRIDGSRLTFLRATLRYFGKIVSGITLLIGYIMAAFTERKQALHDLIADTLVLRK
ncbi:RDD family protein [Adhaeribacter sp. BT258]|uniref:RDD family protein n=1 Tax=Adhaeribacter terrigena TaxID=2793070 RepID=A0ABS1BYQ3_9BACT|nr:RDD family protein [Adhaeribacter terrigena]MBK0402051.1 RDD family protein [Adhaeribacter terrigena]